MKTLDELYQQDEGIIGDVMEKRKIKKMLKFGMKKLKGLIASVPKWDSDPKKVRAWIKTQINIIEMSNLPDDKKQDVIDDFNAEVYGKFYDAGNLAGTDIRNHLNWNNGTFQKALQQYSRS